MSNPRRVWWLTALTVVAVCSGLVVACGGGGSKPAKPKAHAEIKTNFQAPPEPSLSGIHKIRHVVVIMQENRSFDSYFGAYPGVDGIPVGACSPDPAQGGRCVAAFHDRSDENFGGPHTVNNARGDINGGRMNGFVESRESCSNSAIIRNMTRPR